MPAFLKLLEKRNSEFIANFSTGSALGMVETLFGIKHDKDPRKNCVLISFDPPLGDPPIIFNWSHADVHYLKSPEMSASVFEEILELVSRSKFRNIVFVERRSSEHIRKIQGFMRNFQMHAFRNRTLSDMPDFVLAEYSGPLSRISLKNLQEEHHDSLLS